nr:MAG TPA: hypothetical protein [Caudoviricetes sp.]
MLFCCKENIKFKCQVFNYQVPISYLKKIADRHFFCCTEVKQYGITRPTKNLSE